MLFLTSGAFENLETTLNQLAPNICRMAGLFTLGMTVCCIVKCLYKLFVKKEGIREQLVTIIGTVITFSSLFLVCFLWDYDPFANTKKIEYPITFLFSILFYYAWTNLVMVKKNGDDNNMENRT